jgi:glycerophosphoryl diester phosphodiesterase
MSPLPLRIGHRGAAGHAPENTLLSIVAALDLRVDLIEVDVRRTSDGSLIILHDKRVDRTMTNGKGCVSDMTLSDVRRLDAGHGEMIPLLDEVLAAVQQGRAGIMLELVEEGIAKDVVECVRASGFSGQVIYASFLHAEMLSIHEIDNSLSTLALLEGIPVNHTSFAREACVTHVGLGFDSARPRFIQDLHESGHQVFVYTLNNPADIELAISWGVDGIISDHPELIPKDGRSVGYGSGSPQDIARTRTDF